jgi:hypothetical protein
LVYDRGSGKGYALSVVYNNKPTHHPVSKADAVATRGCWTVGGNKNSAGVTTNLADAIQWLSDPAHCEVKPKWPAPLLHPVGAAPPPLVTYFFARWIPSGFCWLDISAPYATHHHQHADMHSHSPSDWCTHLTMQAKQAISSTSVRNGQVQNVRHCRIIKRAFSTPPPPLPLSYIQRKGAT